MLLTPASLGLRCQQGCGTVGAASVELSAALAASRSLSPMCSCHRDPEGADIRGEAGRLQRGLQRQGRRLLCVLGLRTGLRASGTEALRGRNLKVKPVK